MKHLYFAFILLIHSTLQAQEIRKLGIGDTLQATSYELVQNHTAPEIVLPSGQEKLTLLYIMSTSCVPCIKKIPYLQRYRDDSQGKVQIILVFYDDLERINKLKENAEIVRNTTLPILPAEIGLHKKFLYKTFGTTIWIDQEGVIEHQTETEHITPENIHAFLSGNNVSVAKTVNHIVDRSLSVGENLRVDPENKPYFSFEFFKKSETYTSDRKTMWYEEKDSQGQITRLFCYDTDIVTIGKRLSDQRYIHNSRVIIEVTDPERLLLSDTHSRRNSYAFDLHLYDHRFISAPDLLKIQVENFLGLEISKSVQNIKCYVIKRVRDVDLSAKHDYKRSDVPNEKLLTDNVFYRMTSNEVQIINNTEWHSIWNDINWGNFSRKLDYYIVDETGIDPDLKVDFSIALRRDNNLDIINESIAQYGLVMEEAFRPLEVVVIKDKQ